ncbi:MAG: lipoyl protein ligase domain-containing protein [Akkermansiaceae bacterium]
MSLLSNLVYWKDNTPKTGVENMAADQILLETNTGKPILRCYQWLHPTVSFGYFLPLADAQAAYPSTPNNELDYVRRWTGGGIVDHRYDLTYTLAIPRSHPLAASRGAESYQRIHQLLAAALLELGADAQLITADSQQGGNTCFINPVAYDIVDHTGKKIAGAGQRRTRHGLLHQGSVQADVSLSDLGEKLSSLLADKIALYEPSANFSETARSLAEQRYASHAWLHKK